MASRAGRNVLGLHIRGHIQINVGFHSSVGHKHAVSLGR